jgi:hypothetical protein
MLSNQSNIKATKAMRNVYQIENRDIHSEFCVKDIQVDDDDA